MKSRKIVVALLAFLIIGSVVNAQNQNYSCEGDELAFDGNDLVSYFDNSVLKGLDKFSFDYDGLKLYFANDTNRKKFKADPEKYLPAYKGWCATAVANGNLYKPNYNQFKIQNNKLLFFEVRAFFNGKTAWNKNPELNKILADKKFGKINAE